MAPNPKANHTPSENRFRWKPWEVLFLCIGLASILGVLHIYKIARRQQTQIALVQGIKRNDCQAVYWALEHGANPNIPILATKISTWRWIIARLVGKTEPEQPKGSTPLQLVFAVKDQGSRPTYLQEQAEVVRSLASHGANVNVKDENGVPVIVSATLRQIEAHSINSDAVLCLVESRADINAETRNGYSLLLLAIEHENINLSAMLLYRHAKCKMYAEEVSPLQAARATHNRPLMLLAARYH